MGKTTLKIIGGIIIAVLLFTAYQKCSPDRYSSDTTTVETRIDTTTVDSLRSVIEQYKKIAESRRDTVVDTLYIEKPVQIDDSTNRYTNMYSDSTLDATITSSVTAREDNGSYEGVLVDQVFTYSVKQERVRTIRDVITLNTTQTITKTRTLVKEPKSYFSIGGQVGRKTAGPVLQFTNPNKYNIFYSYDLVHGSHSVGFTVPIKF